MNYVFTTRYTEDPEKKYWKCPRCGSPYTFTETDMWGCAHTVYECRTAEWDDPRTGEHIIGGSTDKCDELRMAQIEAERDRYRTALEEIRHNADECVANSFIIEIADNALRGDAGGGEVE